MGEQNMYKAFILDVQFDNGVDVQRKKVACMAPDMATATRLVKKAMEKSADDVANVLRLHEMTLGEVEFIE